MPRGGPAITINVAADLWGQKVNLAVPVALDNCPTWASFVDGVECLMYIELIKRRPVIQLMGGARSSPHPADDEASSPDRRRLNVCDVHTFVVETVYLLVHVVGKAPMWEPIASLSQLYDRCQLFVFQPEGELTSDDNVALLPEPISRYHDALLKTQRMAELRRRQEAKLPPTKPKWWVGAASGSPSKSTSASPTRPHAYRPVTPPPSKTSRIPPFATLHEAATACYLGLLRCQLRALGVSHVLLRQVIEDLLLGVSWSNDPSSAGELARGVLPDLILRQVVGYSEATTWEYVATQYSRAGEGAVDMVLSSLVALANAGQREYHSETNSSPTRHHRQSCRACSEITERSPQGRERKARPTPNRSVSLDEWCMVCEEAPVILMFLVERLMAVSVAACPFFDDAHPSAMILRGSLLDEDEELVGSSPQVSRSRQSPVVDPYHQEIVAQRLMLGLSSVRTRLDRSWEEVHQCASPREE